MNTKTIRTVLLTVGLVFSVHLLQGQVAPFGIYSGNRGPVQPVQTDSGDSIVQLTAETYGLQLVPPEDIPPFASVYWVIESGASAMALPFPCPPPGVNPTYAISDGISGGIFGTVLLVDATATTNAVSQADLEAQATATVNVIAQVQAATANQQSLTMARAMDAGAPAPGGGTGGDAGGSGSLPTNSFAPFNPGTNLWLATLGISNNSTSLLLSNTAPDILFELLGCSNLATANWFSVGFVDGSELTNFTPASVPVSGQGNMFFRIRSWVDSGDTGIPDWWWLQYFGQVTNVNANAEDPAGDSYDNLEKFELGLNPNLYYNTNPPGGLFGALDFTGTNVFLEWSPAPGPVSNYLIQRGVLSVISGSYVYSQAGLANSNATWFEDAGAINNSNAYKNVYSLTAVYPGGTCSATDTWSVSSYVVSYVNSGQYHPPYGPAVPGNVYAYLDATGTNVLLSWTPAQGQATGYVIERGLFNAESNQYIYSPIGQAGSNAIAFEAMGAITNVDDWGDDYEVAAVYPGGIWSWPISTYSAYNGGSVFPGSRNGPAAPGNFFGYVDSTGTNIFLNWTASPGAVTNYPGQVDAKTVIANRNPTVTLMLKKVGKPIAMYARYVTQGPPVFNTPVGYDLTVGDWVGPNGKGITTDIVFNGTLDQKAKNDFDYTLTVSFPKPGDGIQEFAVPDAEKGGGLRSPHEAPTNGYQSQVVKTMSRHPGQGTKEDMNDPNRNYFFRVRTALDENGNVVSAHYGKIYGDFMQFTYYLNPTPNSRNIEFDPKQNLIGDSPSSPRVQSP
jgi:hypothetical protein